MIGRLRGTWEDGLLAVSGVGYAVNVARKPTEGESITLQIYSQTSDNGTSLYGFETKEGLAVFRSLVAVPGVGPSAALAVIAEHGPGRTASIIRRRDTASLSSVRGIGTKTAERIVSLCVPPAIPDDEKPCTEAEQAASGLEALGWSGSEAQHHVAAVSAELPGADAGELLRKALARRNEQLSK